MDFFEDWFELFKEGAKLCRKSFGKITDLTTNARVACGKACAGQELAEVINFFTLGKRVQKNRKSPNIHTRSPNAKKVRRNARQLAADDPDRLSTRRKLPS